MTKKNSNYEPDYDIPLVKAKKPTSVTIEVIAWFLSVAFLLFILGLLIKGIIWAWSWAF